MPIDNLSDSPVMVAMFNPFTIDEPWTILDSDGIDDAEEWSDDRLDLEQKPSPLLADNATSSANVLKPGLSQTSLSKSLQASRRGIVNAQIPPIPENELWPQDLEDIFAGVSDKNLRKKLNLALAGTLEHLDDCHSWFSINNYHILEQQLKAANLTQFDLTKEFTKAFTEKARAGRWRGAKLCLDLMSRHAAATGRIPPDFSALLFAEAKKFLAAGNHLTAALVLGLLESNITATRTKNFEVALPSTNRLKAYVQKWTD